MRVPVVFLLALFAGLPRQTEAQTIKIELRHSTSDPIGASLAYQVREAMRRSVSLQLVDSTEAQVVALLETMDLEGDRQTVYTLIWLLPGTSDSYYMGSKMGLAGRQRLADAALGIVADTDKAVEPIRSVLRSRKSR